MLTCPFCNLELSQVDVQEGHCPKCQRALSDQKAEANAETLADGIPEETESEDSPELAKTNPHNEPTIADIDTRKISELMADSEDSSSEEESENAATVMIPTDSESESAPTTVEDTLIDVSLENEKSADNAQEGPQGLEKTLQSEMFDDLAEDKNIGQTITPRDVTQNDIKDGSAQFQTMIDESADFSSTLDSDPDGAPPGSKSSLVVKSRAVGEFYESQIDGNDYQMIDVLGKGGVGVVYSAKQTSIDRNVALKMLHPKMSKNQDHRSKFLIEAVVIGDLNHPQIVPIYDLGKNKNNDLFYTMKQVEGTPWSDVVDELSIEENLDILVKICNAIAFAHFKGVIHRDLKPDNVMLGDFGEVLVMDWGLALVTKKSEKYNTIKSSPGLGGTPAYMAPEMVTGPIKMITDRSDIYLLGAMLYRVLVGQAPHAGKNVTQCVKSAAQNEIQKTELRGELIDIAMKAMATKPEDRYATAIEFRDALKNFEAHAESLKLTAQAEQDLTQANETGEYKYFARSIFGFEESVSLWADNHGALDGQVRAREAYAESALSNGDFELGLSLLDQNEASHLPLVERLKEGQYERDSRQRQLARSKMVFRWASLSFVLLLSCACLMIYVKMKAAEAATKKEAIAKREALDATQEALDANEEVKQTNKLLFGTNIKLADEKEKFRVATIKAEKSEKIAQQNRALADENRKRAEAQSYLAQIALAAKKIEENRFEEARETLSAYQDSPIVGWEWGYLWDFCNLSEVNLKLNSILQDVSCSDDGQLFAVAGDKGLLQLWKTEAFRTQQNPLPFWESPQPPGEVKSITSVEFSPDHKLLATGDSRGGVSLLKISEDADVELSQELPRPWRSQAPISSICFSYLTNQATAPKQSRWLLVASENGEGAIWDLEAETWLNFPRGSTLRGHRREIREIAITSDRSFILTAGEDDKIQIWSNQSRHPSQPVSTTTIKQSSNVEPYEIWKTVYWMHEGAVLSLDTILDDQGRLLIVSGGRDGSVHLWNLDDVPSNNLTSVPPRTTLIPPTHNAAVQEVHFIRSQTDQANTSELQVLVCGDDRTVQIWDINQSQLFAVEEESASEQTDRNQVPVAKLIQRFRGHGARINACVSVPSFPLQNQGASLFLSVGEDNRVMLWNEAEYNEQETFEWNAQAQILDATFDHDSDQIASVSSKGTLVITDLKSNRSSAAKSQEVASEARKEGHDYLANRGQFVSVSPDQPERWFVTAGTDGKVIVWDLERGISVREYPESGRTSIIALSPDQRQIVTGGPGNLALLGKLPNIIFEPASSVVEEAEEMLSLSGHKDVVTAACFTPDGRWILTADKLGGLRVWVNPLKQAHENPFTSVFSMPVHSEEVTNIHIVGQTVITTSKDYSIKIWNFSADTKTHEVSLKMERRLKGTGEVIESSLSRNGQYFACVRQSYEKIKLENSDSEPTEQIKIKSEVTVYDLDSDPQILWTFSKKNRLFLAVDFFHHQNWLLLTDNQSAVSVWDWESGREDKLKFDTGTENYCARIDASGQRIVTIGGRRVQLWKFDSQQKVVSSNDESLGSKRILGPHYGISKVSFAPDDSRIATGDRSGHVKLWQLETQGEHYMLQYRLPRQSNRTIVAAQFHPRSSKTLLTAWEDLLILWTYNGEKWIEQKRKSLTPDERISYVDYSPSGNQLLVGSQNGACEVWNADNLSLETRMQGAIRHSQPINCGVFSQDEQLIVTGSDDKNARGILWKQDQGQWKSVSNIMGHSGGITAAAFSPIHQRRLLTGSRDGTAKLWDISRWTALGDKPVDQTSANTPTIEELLTLSGHVDEVTAVEFDHTGQYLITASQDGKTIRWSSAPIDPTIIGNYHSLDLRPGQSTVIGQAFEIRDPVAPTLQGGVVSLSINQIFDAAVSEKEASPLSFELNGKFVLLEKTEDGAKTEVYIRSRESDTLHKKIGTLNQTFEDPKYLGTSFDLQIEAGATPRQLAVFLQGLSCTSPNQENLISTLEYKVRLTIMLPETQDNKKLESIVTYRVISPRDEGQTAPIDGE